MVVALVVGESVALVDIDEKVAVIIFVSFIFMAVAVGYGLFVVRRNRYTLEDKLMRSVARYVLISLVCIVTAFCGFFICREKTLLYKKYDEIQYGFQDLTVEGVIKNIQYKNYLYHMELGTEEGTVLVKADNIDNLKLGMHVRVTGAVEQMESSDNPGNYDEYSYLRGNGILIILRIQDSGSISNDGADDEYSFVEQGLFLLKQKITQILERLCTEKEMGLISAMILGEKTYLQEDIKELYSAQGIAHVLAISGLHISIIGMGIYKLMRMRMRYLSSASVSAVIMILFSYMTGNSVSAVRAVIMFVLHVMADVLGRKYDMISAVSLAAFLLLLDNPYYLTNASFLLSFSAMIAVSVVGPVIIEFIGTKYKVVNAVLFNLSLTFTSLPLTSRLFYRIPTYSIVLNLLVVPLMGIMLLMALLGTVAAVLVEEVGAFFMGTAVYVLRLYENLSEFTARLPFSSVVTGNIEVMYVFLYYVLLAVMLLGMKYLAVRRDKVTSGRATSGETISDKSNCGKVNCDEITSGRAYHDKKQRTWTYIFWLKKIACVVPLFIMIFIVYRQKEDAFKICFLDVGQGDGAYIRSESGNDYLIDCGSTDERNICKYKLESFLEYMDVDKLEYVFVSHCDTDHISGIVELLEREQIGVDNIILPETEAISMSANAASLVALARDRGIDVLYFGTDDKLTDGDMEFYCVSPDKEVVYSDINEASMVLLMKYRELNCAFTGDIGEDTEKLIVDVVQEYFDSSSEEKYTVLKVAHHGSRYSSNSNFLEALRPNVAIISAGEGNSYGHPHKEVIERLFQCGSVIMMTSEYGTVTIELEEEMKINCWIKAD